MSVSRYRSYGVISLIGIVTIASIVGGTAGVIADRIVYVLTFASVMRDLNIG